MAGDVVEDIGLGQIVQSICGTDRYGVGKFAPLEAIEEEEGRHVAAHGPGLESGQGLEDTIDLAQPRDAARRQLQKLNSPQEVAVGVAFPARANAFTKALPGFVVGVRVEIVSLLDI